MTVTLATELTDALTAAPVLGIARTGSAESAVRVVRDLARGGLRAIEVSLSSQDALAAFAEARHEADPALVLGIGTVRTASDAADAIAAGAQFLVTPGYSAAVLERSSDAGIPVVCGVLTPTEVQTALDAGLEWLKLFPAGAFGPSYLRDLRAPFPDVRFVPTGGVSIDDLAEFRRAGAAAVGLAGALTDGDPAAAARSALAAWGVADGR